MIRPRLVRRLLPRTAHHTPPLRIQRSAGGPQPRRVARGHSGTTRVRGAAGSEKWLRISKNDHRVVSFAPAALRLYLENDTRNRFPVAWLQRFVRKSTMETFVRKRAQRDPQSTAALSQSGVQEECPPNQIKS
ncbi:hypothetical protein F2P81_021537 [Scophthalmus maximus]|uniref:Uncharacterized protein n=1 Tax=Scophthalmus maximus TaxID=52904 RepID=A0A6A4RMP0_SCOMX|nr:hypothetical protein F2P81_026152 [Scophthalmus maximus]KAF0026800.1 hypothetical protein F2P81_021537 [Scophthalmus maximus]